MNSKVVIPMMAFVVIISVIALIELGKPRAQAQSGENIGIVLGKTAPDFELESLDGKKTSLHEFRGKTVVLNFWASWCPPCRIEMPEFERAYRTNKNLAVVGVNLQESPQTVAAFAEKMNITFPLLLDPSGQVKADYNVFTQPVTFFINEKGIIFEKKLGPLTPEEFEEKLGRMYALN